MTLNPALRTQRQAKLCEFEDSLVEDNWDCYIEKSCLEKQRTTKKRKKKKKKRQANTGLGTV